MNVFKIATNFFLTPLSVFYELLTRTNMFGFYLVMFLLAAVYRLLVAPIIGMHLHEAASDMSGIKAKHQKEREAQRQKNNNKK